MSRPRALICKALAVSWLTGLIFILLAPLAPALAGSCEQAPTGGKKKFGEECQGDSQCFSGDCEKSTEVFKNQGGIIENKWYCDCDDDNDCFSAYGAPSDHGEWSCVDGANTTKDLDYCESTHGEICAPLKPGKSSATDALLDPGVWGLSLQNEINAGTYKPKLMIRLPQLKFSDLSGQVDAEGFLHIPWIGEYIAAVYKFGVAVGSVVAVAIIIKKGFDIVISGGGEGKMEAYKRIGQIVIGLMILWFSYVIMFYLNPDLVAFKALRVKYVAKIALEDNHIEDEKATVIAIKAVSGPCDSLKELTPGEKNRSYVDTQTFLGKVDVCTYKTRDSSNIKKIVIHNGGYTLEMNQNTWYKGCFYNRNPDQIPEKERYDKNGKPIKYKLAGAHYTISKDGKIVQHAAERCVVPHAPGGNNDGIGIELNIGKDASGNSCNSLKNPSAQDVHTACDPTAAQYDSLKKLVDDIRARYNIPLASKNIVGHCELVPSNGHGDPRAFDWTKLGLKNEEKKAASQGHACSWYLPF